MEDDNNSNAERSANQRSACSMKRKGYLEWQEYFMAIAFLSAQRSKDPRTQVGACIVNPENKIVGIGYNGMPNGCEDNDMPWGREADNILETKKLFVCHAELNAVLNKNSSDVKDCTIYVALFPCNECAKIVIQSGIKEVIYYSDKYKDNPETKASRIMFEKAGIKCRQYKPSQQKIVIDFSLIDQYINGKKSDSTPTNGKKSDSTPTNGKKSDITPTNGKKSDITPTNGMNSDITPTNGKKSDITPTHGMNSDNTPTNGMNSDNTSTIGMNFDSTPTNGMNSDNTPTNGMNSDNTSTNGMNSDITPTNGKKSDSTPTNSMNYDSTPTNGMNSDNTPTNGMNSDNTPTNGMNSDNTPTNGKKSDITPTNGKKSDITPTNGMNSDNTSTNGIEKLQL